MKIALIVFSLLALLLASPVHAVGAELASCNVILPLNSPVPYMMDIRFLQDDHGDVTARIVTAAGPKAGHYSAVAEYGDYLVRENLYREADVRDLNHVESLLMDMVAAMKANSPLISPLTFNLSFVASARLYAVTTDMKLPSTAILDLKDAKGSTLARLFMGRLNNGERDHALPIVRPCN